MRRILSMVAASVVAVPAFAALDPSDPSLIVLHKLDEASSGQLDNSVDQSFLDSAPTGTPQPHDDFGDGSSDGPAWGGGAAFISGATTVGTGTGLIFDRSDEDNTRFEPWLNTSQGNYSNGQSFTLMSRVYATSNADGSRYTVVGSGSNHLQLEGLGSGNLRVNARLREGASGGEDDFLFDSFGSTGATTAAGGNFSILPNKWYNIFLIYDAGNSITVAADDGTTFQFLRTNDVASDPDFDTLTHGYSDAGVHWALGAESFGNVDNLTIVNPFDGRIETVAIFDKALSDAEADAIDLTNVPEPATLALLGLGGLMMLRRRS